MLLVERFPLMLRALASALETVDGLSVIGTADSFVYRKADTNQLFEAITAVCRGVPTWYVGGHDRDLVGQVVPGPDLGILAGQLTARELQVLELLLCRYSNAEIADELHLAHQTVKNYVSTILQKLDVSSRRELLSSRQL